MVIFLSYMSVVIDKNYYSPDPKIWKSLTRYTVDPMIGALNDCTKSSMGRTVLEELSDPAWISDPITSRNVQAVLFSHPVVLWWRREAAAFLACNDYPARPCRRQPIIAV